jgi:hypothetical protein
MTVDATDANGVPGPWRGPSDRSWPGSPLRRGLGVALLGLSGAGRFAAGEGRVVAGPGAAMPAEPLVDVLLGILDVALEAGERVSAAARRRLDPLLRAALAPAAAPLSQTSGAGMRLLGRITGPLAQRGRRLRADSEHEAAAAVAAVLPETIELVMDQVDLTELAIDKVDLQRVLDTTVARIDMTSFALQHLDLAQLIQASLDSVDFTDVAIEKIDFSRTVSAALEQVDVLAVARDQVDPARVAAYLRDTVDLAETLRAAPGAVAGEAVRGVRDTVERIVGTRRN